MSILRHAPHAPLATLALFLLGLATVSAQADGEPAAPAKPAPPSYQIEVPVGIPVQIDGIALPAEWADAAQRPLGEDGGVFKMKQHRGALLLAVEPHAPWIEGDRLWLCFTPDTPDAGLYRPPAVRIDYEPFAHNRYHVLAVKVAESGEVLAPGAAIARAALAGSRPSVEMAMRLPWLGVTGDAPPPLRFALLHVRSGGRETTTWPPGLDLSAGASGEPPADLASAAKWGRLEGWQDADGAGALSRGDWDALVQEDEELMRRGMEAHRFVAALAQDGEVAKVDREQQPVLEGHWQWIAEREALTANDLIALAKGYRFLNRKAEALGVLAGFDADPVWRGSRSLLYERALALESAERFRDAAMVWERLAHTTGGSISNRYRAMAERAHVRLVEWSEEQEARRVDDANAELPLVLLRTTRGNVILVLHANDVPDQVRHFLSLVTLREDGRGFYDGTRFHRVIGDFVVQGGDPASRESCEAAGSGDGPSIVAPEQNLRHTFYRGAVGFALGGARMNGCQFFLLVSPKPHLAQQGFTCFGHVLAGMDVVDRIEQCDELLEAVVLRPGTLPEDDDE